MQRKTSLPSAAAACAAVLTGLVSAGLTAQLLVFAGESKNPFRNLADPGGDPQRSDLAVPLDPVWAGLDLYYRRRSPIRTAGPGCRSRIQSGTGSGGRVLHSPQRSLVA
jgi:hypothetical protein